MPFQAINVCSLRFLFRPPKRFHQRYQGYGMLATEEPHSPKSRNPSTEEPLRLGRLRNGELNWEFAKGPGGPSSSIFTTSSWPASFARSNGVRPLASAAMGSALNFKSTAQASNCPLRAA
eukprot:gnl/TRDRNA2_/TRDRNA2_32150_c0_seq1.p1 gnl/TRDRNA2_/TRDRNA2_32150_c0~~gnl/TRDRNA2_/TRDRNA2_32150_c0_seq1.p1  ORF type:complete len:120 (-),score=8.46 gnl/TRDRNA2_/TRDRNA2_32150_c0_seq1:28-387(-)